MKKTIIFIVILLISFLGCENESIFEPSKDQIVIRSYIYANEPVMDIQITGTIPLGDESTIPPPINNANVYLEKESKKYILQPSSGDSGYYHYSGSDLVIKSGDIFKIFAEYNGKTVSAQTEVPPPPENLIISPDTLFISSDIGQFRFDTNRMEANWKEVPSALFYVLIENIEDNPEIITFNGQNNRMPNRFLSPPVNTSLYRIARMNISHYGKHRIKVYRINQEYADLYRSSQQDSRDLNEPLTNVKNGLGIFSAFNSIESYFYVLKK